MSTEKMCIWADQCGADECEGCEFFDSKEFEDHLALRYYGRVRYESAALNEALVREFDGGQDE